MKKCKEQVMRGWHLGQCSRNPVRDGYCKQHHPDSVAAREKLQTDKFEQKQKRRHALYIHIKELEAKLEIAQTKIDAVSDIAVNCLSYYHAAYQSDRACKRISNEIKIAIKG